MVLSKIDEKAKNVCKQKAQAPRNIKEFLQE